MNSVLTFLSGLLKLVGDLITGLMGNNNGSHGTSQNTGLGSWLGNGNSHGYGFPTGDMNPVTGSVGSPGLSTTGLSTKAPGQLSTAERDNLALQVMANLQKDLGLKPWQAAGIVGNFMQESSMYPNKNEGGGNGPPNNSKYGYGWAQWTGGRRDAFLKFASSRGLDPGSPAANYQFLVHELKTTESNSLAKLKKTSSVAEATQVFCSLFERPGDPRMGNRMQYASRYLDAYQDSHYMA